MTTEDWPPLPESIQTPRLLLRRYRLSDAQDVYIYRRDPECGRFLPVEQPYEPQHADAFVAKQVLAKWHKNPIWALEQDGRVVGGLSLWLARRNVRADLGYELARWLWGHGLMAEAASAVIDEAFRRLPIIKMTATRHRRERPINSALGATWHAARGAASTALDASRPGFRRSSLRPLA